MNGGPVNGGPVNGGPVNGGADVASTVRDLADRAAIHDVLLRYCRGADRCDEELIRSAFHPDAHDDHWTFVGSGGDFAAWVVGVLRKTSVATQHTLPNVLIELAGDSAAVETSFVAYHHRAVDHGARIDVFGGRYLDTFERRAGEWRIYHRAVVHDWSTSMPCQRFPNLDAYVQGRRDRSDPVYTPARH